MPSANKPRKTQVLLQSSSAFLHEYVHMKRFRLGIPSSSSHGNKADLPSVLGDSCNNHFLDCLQQLD